MDPASLSLGVVTLAATVVESSRCLREVISTCKGAPSELEEMRCQISVIDRACTDAKVLEKTCPNGSLAHALGICDKHLTDLHNRIGRVNSRKKGKDRCLYYVTQKAEINKSFGKLEASLGHVKFCLQVYSCAIRTMGTLSSVPGHTGVMMEQYPSEPPHYTTENNFPVTPPPFEEESPLKVKPSITGMNRSLGLKHHNAMYPFSAVHTSAWDKGDVKDSRSQVINPHLLGTFVQQVLRAGSPSPLGMILDAPYLIHEDHNKSLYETIRLGPNGPTKVEAAAWFCTMKIPHSAHIVSTRGHRMSILGAMIANNRPTAFNYLLQRAGKKLSNQQHLCHMVLQLKPRPERFVELVKAYLDLRGSSLAPQELVHIVHLDKSPKSFASILETASDLLQPRGEEWNMFMFFNECYLIHVVCSDGADDFDPKPWAACAMKLSYIYPRLTIKEVNVVLYTWVDPQTGRPAQESMAAEEDTIVPQKYSSLQLYFTSDGTYPTEAIDQAERWLSILAHAGRDINRYLDQELEGSQGFSFSDPTFKKPDYWADMTVRGKLQTIFDCLRPGKRLAPEDGTTDNLLEILPAFCYWHRQKPKPRSGLWVYDFTKRNWVKTADQEKRIAEREWSNNCEASDWKDLKANSDLALNSWPMCWDITTLPMITKRVKHMGEGYARYREIVDKRFERRQTRKLRAVGKERNMKRAKATIKLGPVTETWWQSFVGS